MEPPMLIGATISPTSAAFSVTMPSKGERMKDSSRWLSRTLTCAAAVCCLRFGRTNSGTRGGRLRFGDVDAAVRTRAAAAASRRSWLPCRALRCGDRRRRRDRSARFAASFSSRSRRRSASANRISYCLFSAASVCRGDCGAASSAVGLVGKLRQALHFRNGFGHFRLRLSDRGVQFGVIELGDDVALLDELRLGHVQLGEPSDELGGEYRLPVRDDISRRSEFGAAVHALRPWPRRSVTAGDHADFRHLQPPHQARRRDPRRQATATSTTHTQGDTRRRRRERSILNAAKPSEDIFAAPHMHVVTSNRISS